jgi:hypothetical protein
MTVYIISHTYLSSMSFKYSIEAAIGIVCALLRRAFWYLNKSPCQNNLSLAGNGAFNFTSPNLETASLGPGIANMAVRHHAVGQLRIYPVPRPLPLDILFDIM